MSLCRPGTCVCVCVCVCGVCVRERERGYRNRCEPPLCVKLENPELSRKECDHSLYCLLLHSKQVCLCVCERERRREGAREWGIETESQKQKVNLKRKQGEQEQVGEQIMPRCSFSQLPVKQRAHTHTHTHTQARTCALTDSVTRAHMVNCCVCFQSELRGGVCCHPARGHAIRISGSVSLISAAAGPGSCFRSLWIMTSSAKKTDLILIYRSEDHLFSYNWSLLFPNASIS